MALDNDNKPRFATQPNNSGATLESTDGANAVGATAGSKTIFTAGAQGSVVDSIRINSDDSVARVVNLAIKNGADIRPILSVNIPIASGTNGTALTVDPLSNANASFLPISNQGKRHIRLEPGEEIIAGSQVAITAAKKIWISVQGLDFEA